MIYIIRSKKSELKGDGFITDGATLSTMLHGKL